MRWWGWGLLVLIAGVLLAPLALPDPATTDLRRTLAPPAFWGGTMAHPLGTDQLGRDVLARLLSGARASLVIALVSTLLAALVGSLLGIAAGRVGGIMDVLISRLVDAQLAVPAVLLALIVVSATGPSLAATIFIIAASGWVAYARITRAEVMVVKGSDPVLLARVAGISEFLIVLRHIVPSLIPSILVLLTVDIGKAIVWEASLSFLGIGVQAPAVSWGTMIAEGREYLQTAPWLVLIPSITLAAVVLAFSVGGGKARDRLDPTMTEI